MRPQDEDHMVARIYRPAKTAMQSGQARTKEWVLEHEPEAAREVEPLMGWTSSRDMKSQIRLEFASKDEAIAYAERNGIPFLMDIPFAGYLFGSTTKRTVKIELVFFVTLNIVRPGESRVVVPPTEVERAD